ncbi:hypothetical protein K438DRAFT_1979394 [Mycena galopus ATCC 62051]|nr:hypothetical protein K438DRAFT_1979394 [Mycena galopus ATCC 62051]
MPSRLALGALPLLTLGANAYIWPSAQLDALEAARFGQTGYNSPAVPVSELLPNQRAIRRLRPDIGDAFSNTMNTVPLLLCRYISSNPGLRGQPGAFGIVLNIAWISPYGENGGTCNKTLGMTPTGADVHSTLSAKGSKFNAV